MDKQSQNQETGKITLMAWSIGLSETRRSLAEAALWCSLQELRSTHEDSIEEAQRRGMIREANDLIRIAYKDGWHKGLSQSPEWLRAMSLLTEGNPDSLAPLEHQLRSSVLEPTHSIGDFCSESDRQQMVAKVVELRSTMLQFRPGKSGEGLHVEASGRILLYVPSENVSDGASRYASNGFFDPNDAPPWDTWVDYSDGTLTSWVPDILVPLAQIGMDANIVDCIRWKP